MIVASKFLPLILGLAFSDVALSTNLKTLRGQRTLSNAGGNGGGNGGGKTKLDPSGCTILQADIQCEDPDHPGQGKACDEHMACEESATGRIFKIENDLDAEVDDYDADEDAFTGQGQGKGKLRSGDTKFSGDADIDMEASTIKFVSGKGRFGKSNSRGKDGAPGQNKDRRLASAPQLGNKKVLIVKVVSSDGYAPTFSNNQLSDAILGTGGDLVNLSSQYSACSNNQLNFIKGDDKSAGGITFANGVATVTVSVAATSNSALQNAATSALNAAFGNSGKVADYVMLCLPTQGFGGIAYAYLNHWLSVYRNDWCTYVSAQMHEVGHNLDLHHSGENGAAYADQSGFMGYSYSQDDQKMCFNGPKNYQLGWFSNRHVDLNVVNGDYFSGELYGPTKYESTDAANKMIVRLTGGCATCDFYVSFNHDATFNIQTNEGQNKVLVHTKNGTPTQGQTSNLVAKLAAGGTYNAVIGSKTTVITVVSIDAGAGKAVVNVGSAPTPTPPPTPLPPSTAWYNLACGSTANPCAGVTQSAGNMESHQVRCCSDVSKTGWVQDTNCEAAMGGKIWGESDLPTCWDVNYAEAVATCEAHGARLCTEVEVNADCTRGSGCSFDNEMIWTSTVTGSTPPPTTPPPTPSPPPPSPFAKYQLACGATTGTCPSPRQREALKDELHEVRCCSDTNTAWRHPTHSNTCKNILGRDVYGESDNGFGCNAGKTFDEANAICSSVSARLCTVDELEADCTRGTGCGYDSQHIWTSTPVVPCTAHSECADDGLDCTASTCNADGTCTHDIIMGCAKSITCGSTGGSCPSPRQREADTSELHEVRCCSDVSKTGWGSGYSSSCQSTLGRPVYGESDINGVCNWRKTFDQAVTICSAVNARLCTIDELEADCTRGTGCQFDHNHIWTTTPVHDTCSSAADCDDNMACTTDTCNDRGFCEHVEISTCAKELVCGNTANRSCKAPKKKKADLNEKHEVRCCSDSDQGWGYNVRSSCKNTLGRNVWATSKNGAGVCHPRSKTLAEAESICASYGTESRLCTAQELEAKCTQGTGCSFDRDHLWSSSTYGAAAAAATTEAPLSGTGPTQLSTTEATGPVTTTMSAEEITATEGPIAGGEGEGQTLLEIAEAVVTACDESNEDMSECHAYCEDHMCCFENGRYSCLKDPEKHCLAYAGCETLVVS